MQEVRFNIAGNPGALHWVFTKGNREVAVLSPVMTAEEAGERMPQGYEWGGGFPTAEERDRIAEIYLKCPLAAVEEEAERFAKRAVAGEVACIMPAP
jgi:hypothetical protein